MQFTNDKLEAYPTHKSTFRSSNCWSLRLALNQKLAGSIPASGAVAVLYWFRNLAVTQVYIGSIPIGHPVHGRHPAGRKARPPTKWEDEGEGRGSNDSLENS
jgi:hypothetical protein